MIPHPPPPAVIFCALDHVRPFRSSRREAARQTSGKKLLTATSADMSVASLRTAKTACATDIDNDDCGTTGSNAPSSTKGGGGGEGHDDDRYEGGGGAELVPAGDGSSSYGGSSASMVPPTSVPAWRSSPPSSSSSPSPSLSSSANGIVASGPVACVGGGGGAGDATVDTAAAADGGGTPDGVSALPPPPSTTTRWRQSMPRPLLVGSGRVRASYMLHKARGGGSNSNDNKKSSAAGGVGGRRQGGGTWRKRKGPVVRLVSHKTAGNTSFDRLAAEGRSSDRDKSNKATAVAPAAAAEGGGGRRLKPPRCPSASGGGSGSIHRDLEGQGNDEGCFKLKDISFWVACGPSGKVRWGRRAGDRQSVRHAVPHEHRWEATLFAARVWRTARIRVVAHRKKSCSPAPQEICASQAPTLFSSRFQESRIRHLRTTQQCFRGC